MKKVITSVIAAALFYPAMTIAGSPVTLEDLAAKLDALANENKELKQRLQQLESSKEKDSAGSKVAKADNGASGNEGFVKFDHKYAYEVLDPTTKINRKQKLILEAKKNGTLAKNSLYVSGAVTAIANYQKSNTEDKFGYLMRHPTSNNQRTKEVSEAVIHSAQLGLTANLGNWATAYMELLYDPQQSFGPGTTTALGRNQVQVRRGYVLFGDLEKYPYYLALGKMDTPFGLTDTVNPFTASTVWHAFGGLAYGANAGYSKDGWDLNVMAVQGGAQFRAANVPVDDSNTPSKLNNYVVNLSRTFSLQNDTELMLGASYIKGSAYCQGFPVTHFSACEEENGAYDVYAQLTGENWLVQAEYARTEDEWPGTFNPTIPQFGASKVTSWGVGGKYGIKVNNVDVDLSAEFSRFVAGPNGAPWEKQDQIVLGVAGFVTPSTKLFGEFIRTEGYAPLNFISGGNLGDGVTHSDDDARSNVFMMGVNAAF